MNDNYDVLIEIKPKIKSYSWKNLPIYYCPDCSNSAIEFHKYLRRYIKPNIDYDINIVNSYQINNLTFSLFVQQIGLYLFNRKYKFHTFLEQNKHLKESINNVVIVSSKNRIMNILKTWNCWLY